MVESTVGWLDAIQYHHLRATRDLCCDTACCFSRITFSGRLTNMKSGSFSSLSIREFDDFRGGFASADALGSESS